MNLPAGVVGVVGAEDEEAPAAAAPGAGLDSGLTMAAPSVDPMVGPDSLATLTSLMSAPNHFEAAKIFKMSLLTIPLMVLSGAITPEFTITISLSVFSRDFTTTYLLHCPLLLFCLSVTLYCIYQQERTLT